MASVGPVGTGRGDWAARGLAPASGDMPVAGGSGSGPHPSCPFTKPCYVVCVLPFLEIGRLFFLSENLEWPVYGGPL